MVKLRALGIDLGTSLSSAAIIEDGKAVPLRISTAASLLIGDSYCLPSTVFIEESGEILLGQAADNSRMKNPIRYRKEFKRDLGTSEPYRMADIEVFPEDLYREFLKYFKAAAEERLGGNVEKAVVTHPANFAGFKKELIQKAGQMAGFSKLELIDEPTAAAIYYASKEKIEVGEKLLVYDLGGGTFDISIIERTEDGFKPLTVPLGIERCGGVDFQRKIYEDIIATFNDDIVPILSAGGIAAKQFAFMLETESTRIKHHLSSALKAEAVINLPGTFQFKTYELTRERFQNLIKEDIETTCKKIVDIVKNAGLEMKDIDKVLLVGGSSRIPYVEEAIKTITGKPVSKDADTELIVALGAAIYAGTDKSSDDKKEKVSKKSEVKVEKINSSVEENYPNEKELKEDIYENPIALPEKYKYFFKSSQYTSREIITMEIGSSFSRAACVIDGQPRVLINSYGEKQIPTAICFNEDKCLIGTEAKQNLVNPKASVFLDINNLTRLQKKIEIDGVKYQPELLYAFIIQYLKEGAETYLEKRVSQVVLVTPLYLSYNMKKAIKHAARHANVEILDIIDESAAAAIDYSYKNPHIEGTFLLCNAGGECTEFSIFDTGRGRVTTTHKLGFMLNGGNDYTRSIMDYVISECRRLNGIDLLSQPWLRENIFIVSEAAKKDLMKNFNTSIRISGFVNSPYGLKYPFIDLKKSDYAGFTSGLTNRIAANCDLKGILGTRISKVILTGEGANTPLIRERIYSLTKKEVVIPEEAETSAVNGGAIKAAIVSNTINNFITGDCLNKSVGIKAVGGNISMLIPKSSILPAQASKVFTAGAHFQMSEGIVIVESEDGNMQGAEVLGKINLSSLISQTGEAMQVEVKINVTQESLIQLRIRNIKSNKEIHVTL